jgi:hypothetical protein
MRANLETSKSGVCGMPNDNNESYIFSNKT